VVARPAHQSNGPHEWGAQIKQKGVNQLLTTLMAYLTVAYMDLRDREDGQGLVEYALILVFVSVVAIAALTLLGGSITSVFGKVTNSL
jgi:pilus assembly protein Flp/PilA